MKAGRKEGKEGRHRDEMRGKGIKIKTKGVQEAKEEAAIFA